MTGFFTLGAAAREGVLSTARQGAVAAAGADQATATTLPQGTVVTTVTGASGANGVVLNKAKVQGRSLVVYSSAATNALLIYPPVGGTINNGTANAAFSATARTPIYLISLGNDGLTWIAK